MSPIQPYYFGLGMAFAVVDDGSHTGVIVTIKTPQTDPDHPVVGHLFVTQNMYGDEQIYYCDSYDPRIGFWMTLVNGVRRTNVSERAIDRTFHTIRFDHFDGVTRAWSRWGSPFIKRSQ